MRRDEEGLCVHIHAVSHIHRYKYILCIYIYTHIYQGIFTLREEVEKERKEERWKEMREEIE